jgi:hypothetical protein
MSLKLSRNKVNCLSNLITSHIQKNEELDYNGEIGNIRFKIYHIIMSELKLFEQIENRSREKMETQKRSVQDGTREYEILFRKFITEELNHLGKFWE